MLCRLGQVLQEVLHFMCLALRIYLSWILTFGIEVEDNVMN